MSAPDLTHRSAFGCVLVGLMIGSILSAGAVSIGLVPIERIRVTGNTMQYADVVSIMLTSVGVLVTVLGVGIAILALWGIRHMREVAKETARKHVKELLQDGGELRPLLETTVDSLAMRHAQSRKAHSSRKPADNRWGDSDSEYGD